MYEDIIDGMLPTLDKQGMTAPDFPTILDSWKNLFRAIYGDDIYLEPDSKDGVLLSLIAYALHGCNNTALAVWNSFSPLTSEGEGLSRLVKINGISRKSASHSSVDLLLTGRIGTVISQGQVRDDAGNLWLLPSVVTLDLHGEATVTATCQEPGAISAAAGAISIIATPMQGWYSATNPLAATEGSPVETDATLRQRQAASVAVAARSVMEGIHGALVGLDGVVDIRSYDNDSNETDDNGIPAHNIAIVVDGGDSNAIARTIALKKAPGVPTWGTSSEDITDNYGQTQTINFFRPGKQSVYAEIKLRPLTGYTTAIGNGIAAGIAKAINLLTIGEKVYCSRLYGPAILSDDEGGETYEILSLEIGLTAENLAASNIDIAFNQKAFTTPGQIKITAVVE
ncbi:hypothetical protein TUM12370_09420 [Salmonella enterica subsp. enterica serovar Choleraesuis]|nr:hypothetical protein TUM12370_09420 [Salmonella enterica subsp. enterica serovar Choleraesuis]